jgi:hypothetical protein
MTFGWSEWVAEEYARRGDAASALELQLTRWQPRPSMQLYETLEQLAKKLGQWASLRPRLLAELEQGPHPTLLADIYLRDKEWDAAWAVAENVKASMPAWTAGWGNLGHPSLAAPGRGRHSGRIRSTHA